MIQKEHKILEYLLFDTNFQDTEKWLNVVLIEHIWKQKISSLTAVALKSGTVGGSAGHPPSFWDWTNEQYEISNTEKIVSWIMVSVCLEFFTLLYHLEHSMHIFYMETKFIYKCLKDDIVKFR